MYVSIIPRKYYRSKRVNDGIGWDRVGWDECEAGRIDSVINLTKDKIGKEGLRIEYDSILYSIIEHIHYADPIPPQYPP